MANIEIFPSDGNRQFDDASDFLVQNDGAGLTDADAASLFTLDAIKSPFSRIKPVRLYNPFPIGEWYKGIDGLCGFNIDGAKAKSWQELILKYDNGMNGWMYEVPRGDRGEGYPIEYFRISDFEGYCADALPMTRAFSINSTVYQTDTTSTAYITNAPESEIHALRWQDFEVLGNYYFGVLLWREDTASGAAVTATETLVNGGWDATFNPTQLPRGKYKAYPFITNDSLAWQESLKNGQVMYTIPMIAVNDVTVVASGLNILVQTERVVTSSSFKVNYVVQVRNTLDKTITLSNNNIEIYREAINMSGNGKATISDTVIAANANYQTIGSGTITLGYENLSENEKRYMNLWVLVTLQDSTYRVEQQVLPDLSTGDKYINLLGEI